MEALIHDERTATVGQKAETDDGVNSHSLTWWRLFAGLLEMSISGPFVSEWEKKTDLPWREGW